MSDPQDEVTREIFLKISRWREDERIHMIESLRELIDEAKKKAKARRASPNERIRWTRLAGQLIWYKDSILRSMTQEGLEREVSILKRKVFGEQAEEKPQPDLAFLPQPSPPNKPVGKTREELGDYKQDKPRKAENQP